jgi:hypothetical protein
MNKFLVTYDLVGTNESSADYERLIERIKGYSGWGKVQKSVWLISSSQTATEVRDQLAGSMDSNDRLLVIKVTGTAAWQNEICDRDWLKRFLNS